MTAKTYKILGKDLDMQTLKEFLETIKFTKRVLITDTKGNKVYEGEKAFIKSDDDMLNFYVVGLNARYDPLKITVAY